MRKESLLDSMCISLVSGEERICALDASIKSMELKIMGNLGMKPLRVCKVCGKEANNALELEKFKSASECKFKRQNLCNECYDKKYMKRNNERRILFKGKQVYIPMNMRLNVCEVCGRTKEENLGFQMGLHHDYYNNDNVLDYTVEECLWCHGRERNDRIKC